MAVSVLLPVFDADAYLQAAVESVLAQTFESFELIAVDDGSTDGSRQILNRFAERDPRVRVLSRPNTGIVGALNDGLAVARGQYIARMDADDLCHEERLARQVAYLDAHPDCVLVGCDHLEVDAEAWPIAPRGVPVEHEEIERVLLSGVAGAVTHAACMMRRSALDRLSVAYRSQYPVGEDLDLFLRLAELGRLANLCDVLYSVRRHPTSVSRSGSEQHFHDLKRQIVRETLERRGLSPDSAQIRHTTTDRSLAEHHAAFALRAARAGNRRTACKHAALALRASPCDPKVWRSLARSAAPVRLARRLRLLR